MYFNNSTDYERVSTTEADADHDVSPRSPSKPTFSRHNSNNSDIPTSPPPSFRSRVSSRRNSAETHSQHDIELDDAFAAPSDDESDSDEADSSTRRLMENTERNRSVHGNQNHDVDIDRRRNVDRRVTEMNMFIPEQATQQAGSGGRVYGGGQGTRDGVFANISAKPTPGEDLEEKPPTYEQAAADATPPYWETTILAPGAFNSDDVFVDGLIVGSLFSFVWNALISMSFQLIGFLLTYLLHTTHAAKHGSRAGLGITLIQYGFTFRAGGSVVDSPVDTPGVPGEDPSGAIPSDPNAHDFDPGMLNGGGVSVIDSGISTSDWISYALMIVGWFILIRAVSDFIRARRQEEMVRASPDRGLGIAVVAENERPETAV